MIAPMLVRSSDPHRRSANRPASPRTERLGDLIRGNVLYGLAAEVSYILRWLILKSISITIALVPGRRAQRERTVIKIGNTMFDAMATRELYAGFDSYIAQMPGSLEQYVELFPKEHWLSGREILDLGSGLGQYSNELIQSGAASVTGLEYQESKADWSAARFASSKLRFVTGSAEAMPFDAGSFDTVFSHTVFEHIDNVEYALREVRRVLRPDGFALISYNFFHHRGGHHLFPYINFPWATWIVSESALCAYWSERLEEDHAAGLMGFYERGARIRSLSEGSEIHLNKLTFDEFEAILPGAGLRIVRRQPSEQLMRLLPVLDRIPRIRYFLTGTVFYVLQPAA